LISDTDLIKFSPLFRYAISGFASAIQRPQASLL
jgi:hypothetical protein